VKFTPILKEVVWLLVTEKRVSYRRLAREFDLDVAALEDLRFELIEVQRLAVDRDGELLVWFAAAQFEGETRTVEQPPPIRLVEGTLPASAEPREASVASIAAAARARPAAISSLQAMDVRRVPSSAIAEPTVASSDAERRPLTVMFCDLAGSTALSGKLDPEDLQDVIRAYRECCTSILREYEGFIAKYMGDGILVYFGYPQSLERNAERAIRSGLAIVAAMTKLNDTLGRDKGIDIAVRIGVATGLVVVGEVVGEGLAQERTVIGEAPNVAARLQGIAPRNGIVIGALTKEIAGDAFVYEDLGAHELKGITGLVKTWGVVGLRAEAAEDDTEIEDAGAPTLVGRDEEIGLLRRAWQSTKDEGRGQVVLVSGEPGIGKSTLVNTLRGLVRTEGLARITFRCSPYHTNSALYPVIEHIRRIAGWQLEDDAATRLDKLEAMFAGYSLPRAEAVPLFAALLSLPVPADRYPPLDLTPQQLKQQTEDLLVAWTLEEAERQPLLEVWEDLHWADPSTLELLHLVVEQAPTVPLLLVFTYRPEFTLPWPPRSHVTPITLSRLERPQIEAMVTSLAGNRTLPAEVMEHIVSKTDGVPLFVEELTKTVLRSGVLRREGDQYVLTGPLSELTIPASLQGSLMARLDRLPTVREVAQLGAVLGREFAYEVLQAIGVLEESKLRDGLGQLVEAELLYQRGRPPRARYIFKHALIQDAAYQSLLKRTRQQYHRRVAELLESKFPEVVEAQPELLARHFTEAGRASDAVTYWQRAGEKAARRSANEEAIGHLTAGLAQLTQLAETPDRARRELEIQWLLGRASLAGRGYASPQAIHGFARARELCALINDASSLCPVLFGLWLCELGAANHTKAARTAAELIERAERRADAGARMAGIFTAGISGVHLGHLALANRQLAEAINEYSGESQAEATRLAFEYGVELGAPTYAYAAWCQWLLGYPDQAARLDSEALAIVERIRHAYTYSRAFYWSSAFHAYRREWHLVEERATTAIDSARERGLAMVAAVGQIMRGAARAMLQAGDEGMTEIQEAMRAYRQTGARFHGTYHLILLADALAARGRDKEGLEALDEAATLIEETDERYVEAEMHRLRGELLLAQSADNQLEAERCFHEALDVARKQEAKSFELRAATGLARLRQRQGRGDDARDLLAPVYGWFTEGFDTHDLKDAKALLDELA
jgi:predicted ATPase/class 3 adenylate cyclase